MDVEPVKEKAKTENQAPQNGIQNQKCLNFLVKLCAIEDILSPESPGKSSGLKLTLLY